MLKAKIILTGNFGVGKTSLFQRFLFSRFDEKYLTTIGVKVDKRVVKLETDEVQLFLWDVAGEVSQDKVPLSYFLGAHGIIYVFDVTRPLTYENIEKDINYLKSKAKKAVIKVVGNKSDLLSSAELADVLNKLPYPSNLTTSAKTGTNVEKLFEDLAQTILDKLKG
jgi:small GTP-binding protein